MFLLRFTFARRLLHLHRQQRYTFTKRKAYADKGYVILPDAAPRAERVHEDSESTPFAAMERSAAEVLEHAGRRSAGPSPSWSPRACS
jgi:hypothetical protein